LDYKGGEKKMMMNKKMMQMKCMYMALGMIVLGALILANVYWTVVDWPTFVGTILILAGFIKLLMHKKGM